MVLLLIGGAFEHGLEEEKTEHSEHDEEFHGNNDPKGFTPSHLSETVDVESQRFSERVDNVHVRKKEKKESVNGEGEPRRDVASVFSDSLQTMGAFGVLSRGVDSVLRNGYRLFARFEALFCYVMFYKNTGLIRNYQSFDSYICHSR